MEQPGAARLGASRPTFEPGVAAARLEDRASAFSMLEEAEAASSQAPKPVLSAATW